jgi:hypothetical protein
MGVFLKKYHQQLKLPIHTHQSINGFVLYVSLPAMALYYVPKIHFSWEMALPFAVGILILGLSVLFFYALQNIIGYNRNTLGALVLSCGFGNVSFMGYPLIEAFYGKKGIETAVLIDQGTFLVLSTLGVFLAVYFSDKKVNTSYMFKKLLYFPSFGAFLIGILMATLDIYFPESFQTVFKRFADTLTPLALFSVGWQISWKGERIPWKYWIVGLGYKLFIAPFFFYIILQKTMVLQDKVVVLEAAMAPMITSSLMASEHGLNPQLTNFLVTVGIPISLLTVYFWYRFMI